MKILGLDLIAYGPFTGKTLRFPTGGPNLHLIYGPNEAGKSSALRALSDALYGVPLDTKDKFLHSYDDLRVGLTLDFGTGPITVVRRKGKAASLRKNDAAETVFSPAEWAALLPVADRAQFQQMFGIDHDEVANGGKLLLAHGSDMGGLLFAAAGDVDRLRSVRADLKKSAEELYAKNARLPQINKAVSDLKRARTLVTESQTLLSGYKSLRDAVAEAASESTKLEKEIHRASQEAERLRRLQQAAPIAAKRQFRIERMLELEDAPSLPPDFESRYRDALNAVRESSARIAGLEREISDLTEKIESSPVSDEILDHETEIVRLYQQSAAIKQSIDDRTRWEQSVDRLRVDCAGILESLGVRMGLEAAADLRVPDPAKTRIFTLSNNKQALDQEAASSAAELQKALGERDRTSAGLAELGAVADTSALEDVLSQVSSGKDWEGEYVRISAEAAGARTDLERSVAALPGWIGTWDALEAAAAPLPPTIAEFQNRFLTQDGTTNVLVADKARLRNERDRATTDLRTIEQEQDVPTEQDLESSRMLRDSNWTAIRADWLAGIAPDALPRASALEDSIKSSDNIADRLRREADRASRKAGLVASLQSLEEQADRLEKDLASSQDKTDKLRAEWTECWRTIGVVPGTPAEMQSWLSRRDAILGKGREVRQNEREAERLRNSIASMRAALLSKLEGAENAGLAALAAHARRMVARQSDLRQRKRDLDSAAEKSVAQIVALEARRADAKEKLAEWNLNWTEATGKLPVRPGASPEEVQVVVDRLTALAAKKKEMEDLTERAGRLTSEEERFRRAVAALTGSDDSFAAIALQNSELQQNRTNRDLLKTLAGQLKDKQRALGHAKEEAVAGENELLGLCHQAGSVERETLPDCIRKAAEKSKIADELAELEDTLLRFAAGESIARLLAGIEESNPDELPNRINQLHERIETLRIEKTRQDQALGASQSALKQKENAHSASEAAEDAEYLRSRIVNLTNEYIRLRLAGRVLDNAVERYREKNQGPLLKTAGQLFWPMTSGSFADLRVDWNERGEAVLVGVRPDGKQVDVEGMSEGTRDQLFLSLRLAYIANFCQSRGPAPLIADDVLMTFDDTRATAALRTLEGASRQTQILLFTHHRHHLELAAAGLAAGSYCVHHLG